MAAPVLLSTYPADTSTGIPVGDTIRLKFDKGVDLSTVLDHVVLYGADFDITSGPDTAIWINEQTGKDPYYLKSPGFQGVAELRFQLKYYDLSTGLEVDPGVITSEADEAAYGTSGVGHMVVGTPVNPMAPDVAYNLYIMGDPDSVGRGISSRTVFDLVPNPGNAGTTGVVANYGGYTGSSADTVNIKITTSGDVGTAKYKWWYTSLGEGSAITERVTSRRYRKLQDGLQVRFGGSGFVSGDSYSFNVEPIERLATNTKLSFTTNDGTYSSPPTSPSTPAESSPPSSTVIPGGASAADTIFYIIESSPEDGSYNNPTGGRVFTVTFSEDVDATSITDNTVKVFLHDVDGYYDNGEKPREIKKSLSVSGNVLTIEV